MQLTRTTGWTVVAAGVAGATLVTVVGMSRPEPSLPTQAHGPTSEPTTAAAVVTRPYPDPKPVPVSTRLLPNLRSLPPEDVAIRVDGGQRQLWFTSIIANAGIGPAEVIPDELLPCPPGQQHASQVLYLDSGGNRQYDPKTDLMTTTRRGGCMLDHPGHGHWHFDAMARYALTRQGQRSPLVSSDKVSFCLRDNRATPSASRVKVAKHYGDCGPEKVQGISPGWADVYDTDLPDQHLALPAGLPDGRYCLYNEADPLELLMETDDEDNASAVAVRIRGNAAIVEPGGRCA
ncbi:MAG TPA: lysyl oxidase family protein [Jiangellaceae bacterium]|jgi:Lysyl oxidase|nr:lysyl oxidase family protein [Jiangellaceae bacterium]